MTVTSSTNRSNTSVSQLPFAWSPYHGAPEGGGKVVGRMLTILADRAMLDPQHWSWLRMLSSWFTFWQ
eukprot:3717126-Amphidinium_carterae.2